MSINFFEGTFVKSLSFKDFEIKEDLKLLRKGCSLILIYAPWCPHCQSMKDDWIKLAEQLPTYGVYAIDSDKEKKLVNAINEKSKYKIKGYPTIWLFKEGKYTKEYTGDRDLIGFLQFSLNCKIMI